MKNSWADIFEFNKRDRIGILVLGTLLLLLVAANQFMYLLFPQKEYDYSRYAIMLDKPANGYKEDDSTYTAAPAKSYDMPNRPTVSQPVKAKQVVELNAADSLTLLQISGIGPAFASRIIKYRNILGGFINKEQLMEVYGLDKEKYDFIKPYVTVSGKPKKINLNTATFKEVNKHPYISYDLTKAIFNLHKKLGTFKSVEDIKQIDLVNDELYGKIAPYLMVE